jgi:transposase
MIRSRTVNTIHELSAQGKSIQDIAITLGIARNTVRKYLRHPELVAMPHPRPNRRSKLDPFKEQVKQWITEDHCYNCEAMLPRLQAMGYKGSLSVLKAFVHPLRPPAGGHYPVIRYETKPGEQVQFDWGEFKYEQDGAPRKLYGFTAILCYSRMRFVTFVKRCDAPTMIRCLMEAFEYFGGLPKAALTDRMKSVLVEMEEKKPRWNPLFADFMASIGVAPRVCKAYTPQTKGKVERTVGFAKHSYWAGVSFTDIDDLNRQAHIWCERINLRVHRTTHERPRDRREREPLAALPQAFAWERFATEDGIRQLGWVRVLRWGLVWLAHTRRRWPEAWFRSVSDMGCFRCGRQGSCWSSLQSALVLGNMSSILINFERLPQLHPGGPRSFPLGISEQHRRS